MRAFSRLFSIGSLATVLLVIAVTAPARATTRAPASVSESSLLYWRYLCREQPQKQSISKGTLELSCPAQAWTVRANARDGKVSEVVNE